MSDFLAIGNEELDAAEVLGDGDTVQCHVCGGEHTVKAFDPLLVFECGEDAYLAGIDGKSLMGKWGKGIKALEEIDEDVE